MTLFNAQNDDLLERLWEDFGTFPCGEDERMEIAFLHFPAGTHREDIWHWFDDSYSKGVYSLMFPSEDLEKYRCPRCGEIDNGDVTIADHGMCYGCFKKWQFGASPEEGE